MAELIQGYVDKVFCSVAKQNDGKYKAESLDFPSIFYEDTTLDLALEGVSNLIEDHLWDLSLGGSLPTPIIDDLSKLDFEGKHLAICLSIKKIFFKQPKILYHYCGFRDWTFGLFKSPYIWFSNPSDFNDPFELPRAVDYKGISPSQKFKLFKDEWEREVRLKEAYDTPDEGYMEILLNRPEILESVSQAKMSTFEASMNEAGVACFSRRWDIILMWSHYTQKHTGFVIGYNFDKLFKEIGDNAFGGDCDYRGRRNLIQVSELPLPSEKNLLLHPVVRSLVNEKIMSKSPFWKYEEEYRFVSTSGTRNRVPISYDCIEEIYYGISCEESNIKKIRSFVNDREINQYRVVRTDNFSLERVDYAPTS